LSPGPESPANTVTNEIMSLNLDNIFQLDTYVVMGACEFMCVLRASKYREKTHTIMNGADFESWPSKSGQYSYQRNNVT